MMNDSLRDSLSLAWTVTVLIAYLVGVLVAELALALFKFARSAWREAGAQRYGS